MNWSWSTSLAAPPPTEGERVAGMQLAGLMYEAAMTYLGEVFGADTLDGLASHTVRPLLTATSAQFKSPVVGGVNLRIGVRAASSARKAFVLEQVVLLDDDKVASTGTVSLLTFDIEAGRAVEVPADILDRMCDMDGRPVPTPDAASGTGDAGSR
jgi:acyl-CoA thioesterase FadM